MYLRTRGWTDNDTFSIMTAAGEMRPRITGPTTCTMDMGRAKLASKDYPSGPEDGTGEVGGYAFQHVSIGNPQCSIEIKDRDELEALDLPAIGPSIERSDLFPNRTNVSFIRIDGATVRARIFERGVGETTASGTGASGAAVAASLRGSRSPITVQLDGGELVVEISEELDVKLTGTASCVYRGEISGDLAQELSALG
jgi:diaminopimelate epimerase